MGKSQKSGFERTASLSDADDVFSDSFSIKSKEDKVDKSETKSKSKKK